MTAPNRHGVNERAPLLGAARGNGAAISRYGHALRFALDRQANAYGFTLVIWGTGALATWQLGNPDPADVFAYLGGALLSVVLIVTAAFGLRRPFRQDEPSRRPFSALHLPSVPAAVAAGWGLTTLVGGVGGFFLAGFVGAGLYQVLLAAEVAAALAPGGDGGSEVQRARAR